MTAGKHKGKKGLTYWRSKADKRRTQCKQMQIQINRLRIGRDIWRSRYKEERKKSICIERVKGHRYSLQLMYLGIVMHISHNISLRAVCATLKHIGQLQGVNFERLSATTIRNWSIRLGLHYLSRQAMSGNYALIVDESVSIGQEKILLILGVPVSDKISRIAPLRMQDVQVLHVASQTSWKGADLSAILEQWRTKEDFHIDYAISDGAYNLKHGLHLSQIPWVYDCSHVVSNQIRKMFEKDEALNTLVKHLNTTRTLWPSCQWATYMPPSMRKKARFHQILSLHAWAGKMLHHYEQLPAYVQQQLAYLKQYEQLIQTLKTLSMLAEKFCTIFKAKGINHSTIEQWREKAEQIAPDSITQDPKINTFKNALDLYLHQTIGDLPVQHQIICCSDVIESMFGKYKNKSGPQMISQDILKIPAFTQNIDIQHVKQAMINTSNQAVQNWAQLKTVPSLLSLKRKINKQFLAA